jgi:hypothetical protein
MCVCVCVCVCVCTRAHVRAYGEGNNPSIYFLFLPECETAQHFFTAAYHPLALVVKPLRLHFSWM